MLTAAHCCQRPVSHVSVGEEGKYNIQIEGATIHPKFSSTTFKYDICVVTLVEDVTTDDKIKQYVSIARLPNGRDCDIRHGLQMDATGWGYYHGCKENLKLFQMQFLLFAI